MKIFQICCLLLLYLSCNQSKFTPDAKATKIISLEYNCPDQSSNDEFYDYLKNKINWYSGEVEIQEITPPKKTQKLDLLITSNIETDESSFIQYLLNQTRMEFWHVYTPKSVPVFAKIMGDENMPYKNRMKMNHAVFKFDYVKDTARTNEFLKANQSLFPKDIIWQWKQSKSHPSSPKNMQLYGLRGEAQITNKNISSATIRGNEYDDTFIIEVEFDDVGTEIWNRMKTEAYNDKKRSIVTVINDDIKSIQSINSSKFNKRATVYGSFSQEEAHQLVENLQDSIFNYCDLKIVSIKNIE